MKIYMQIFLSLVCEFIYLFISLIDVITTPTLWVGTSNGSIYIYTITMPANDCRTSDLVACQLGLTFFSFFLMQSYFFLNLLEKSFSSLSRF